MTGDLLGVLGHRVEDAHLSRWHGDIQHYPVVLFAHRKPEEGAARGLAGCEVT